jgi:hypothetical protein
MPLIVIGSMTVDVLSPIFAILGCLGMNNVPLMRPFDTILEKAKSSDLKEAPWTFVNIFPGYWIFDLSGVK